MGYAIGDALGLGTEFMTRSEAHRRYPGGLRTYGQMIRDAHRSQWHKGDYTADTEFIIELAESLIELGKFDPMDYARRLKRWYINTDGADVGAHIRTVIAQPDYEEHPHQICRQIYEMQPQWEAHNESLGRAMFIGLWPKYTEQDVADNIRLTHWDSRCVASGAVIARAANDILWHNRAADFDTLKGIASRIDARVVPFIDKALEGELDDFELDDKRNYWYTRKAMGCALWALQHCDDPEKALYKIVDEGGDADTNAALALGLLGLKYGTDHLPRHLIDTLINHTVLENLIDRVADTIEAAR